MILSNFLNIFFLKNSLTLREACAPSMSKFSYQSAVGERDL